MPSKERPIINGHVIAGRLPPFKPVLRQGIRDGLKTMTRRVIKPLPPSDNCKLALIKKPEKLAGRYCWNDGGPWQCPPYFKCPYGIPGDIRVMIEPLQCVEGGNYAQYKDDGSDVSNAFSPEPFLPVIWRWSKPWLSSIHMPYEAARTLVMIKDIRVERLQDITAYDAIAEGIPIVRDGCTNHVDDFRILWDSINAKKCPWESNPWVWVVEFKGIA